MKTDLATAIIAAIAGTVIAYFVTNIFIPPIEVFTYTTVDSSIGADYDEPNGELFNARALNPTVEVFVGDCTEYDENGECLDELYNQDNNESSEEENEDENENENENYSPSDNGNTPNNPDGNESQSSNSKKEN